MNRAGGLVSLKPFPMGSTPTIPATAGIQINAPWIPPFAGMVGL